MDLFLGSRCVACAHPGQSVCHACHGLLEVEPHLVQRAGIDVPVVAAGQYRPVLQHVVPAYKDDGALHLERLLARRLATAVAAWDLGSDVVLVPVPSTRAAVRRRGYDHGKRLAQSAARQLGMGWRGLLRRRHGTQHQKALSAASRAREIRGTMVAKRCAAPLMVTDDVITTGSSLAEAVRALRAAGNTVVGATVIGDADW